MCNYLETECSFIELSLHNVNAGQELKQQLTECYTGKEGIEVRCHEEELQHSLK